MPAEFGSLSVSVAVGNYRYPQPAVQYYNAPISGGASMFFAPFSGPMFYSTPILPVDEGTLQDYIRKQMLAVDIVPIH